MTTTEWILVLSPIVIIQIGLAAWALYDIWKRGGAAEIRGLSAQNATIVWIVVVLVLNYLGPLAYFLFGRKEEVDEE